MGLEGILLEKGAGIAVVTFNRPEALNALNNQTRQRFREVMSELENDVEVKAVILTGTERAFVAGSDIKELKAMTPIEAHDIIRLGEIIERFEKPVIAAVNGYALGGGCEIVMACDIIIASERAMFGQPEINIGIIPGGGGTQRLPRIVGVHKAKELIFTGEVIPADVAESIGLVNKVVPEDALLPTAKEIGRKISEKSMIAMRLIKSAINQGMRASLAAGLELEKALYSVSLSTEDKAEGIDAFIEKRDADFKGK